MKEERPWFHKILLYTYIEKILFTLRGKIKYLLYKKMEIRRRDPGDIPPRKYSHPQS